MLPAILKETFLTHQTQVGQRGLRLRDQGRKFDEEININRVRNLVMTVKLAFSGRLLKLRLLISKLMSPSCIVNLSEICRIIHAALTTMWH